MLLYVVLKIMTVGLVNHLALAEQSKPAWAGKDTFSKTLPFGTRVCRFWTELRTR